jgi:hypothetical protein
VTYFLNILESATPPPKLPTHTGCSWCDLTTADCPEKIEPGRDSGEDDVQEIPL